MIYKKGDVVRIKSWDCLNRAKKKNGSDEFRPPWGYKQVFVSPMCKYCGKTATIIEVNEQDMFYKLDIDNQGWNWEDWMFDLSFLKEKNTMKYKKGDVVRIRSRDWLNEHDTPEGYNQAFIYDMYEYCGKTATIIKVDEGYKFYRLDIDNKEWNWEDWMFDPNFKADEPLPVREAVLAMLNGEILVNGQGIKHKFEENKGFVEIYDKNDNDGRTTRWLDNLHYILPKRKRLMMLEEAWEWAKSTNSHGWMVRCGTGDWVFPSTFDYILGMKNYQRVKILSDLSGIDESTIQDFETEE
jgi:hypothetical protein